MFTYEVRTDLDRDTDEWHATAWQSGMALTNKGLIVGRGSDSTEEFAAAAAIGDFAQAHRAAVGGGPHEEE